MEEKIYNLLYRYEQDGEECFDLSEVQLLEFIDEKRTSNLIELLENDDKYIVYQAMLILIAWNIEEGFNKFNQFYSERWDKKLEFAPHRIWGDDNVYDIIAHAFSISLLNGNAKASLSKQIKKLLSIYGEVFFESNLKSLLLESEFFELLEEIESALNSTLEKKKYYQASQLFVVITKYSKEKYLIYKNIFSEFLLKDNRIQYNLEEAKNFYK